MVIASLVTWLITAAGGFVMLARWIPARRHGHTAGSRFPVPVVAGHGLSAVATLVLVLPGAPGVGGS